MSFFIFISLKQKSFSFETKILIQCLFDDVGFFFVFGFSTQSSSNYGSVQSLRFVTKDISLNINKTRKKSYASPHYLSLSPSLTHSLSVSLTHSQTRTRTHAHTQTLTRTRTHTMSDPKFTSHCDILSIGRTLQIF